MSNIDILNKLSEGKQSKWFAQAEWRLENANWLEKSARIVLRVLVKMKQKGMTKKEFAEAMDVTPQYISKLLQGNENMGLETISKMEEILGITLIEIPEEYQTESEIPGGSTTECHHYPIKIIGDHGESDSIHYTDGMSHGIEKSA
jgi:transcriptional regulator with XRE-family HTH domain